MNTVNCPACKRPANQIIDRAPDGTETLIVHFCDTCKRGKVEAPDHPMGRAAILAEKMIKDELKSISGKVDDSRFYQRHVPG